MSNNKQQSTNAGPVQYTGTTGKNENMLAGRKILIVDDDARNLYAMTNILEMESAIILIAENGEQAIRLILEDPSIEIVLMDIMMPCMDGEEATRQIRMTVSKELPVIGLTSKAMKGDREKYMASGFSDYLTKPIDVDHFLTVVKKWLP